MRIQPRVALVCAGALSRSGLVRLAALRQRIRWVKSSTISAAGRAANALGSGTPVGTWAGLENATLVLIQAPDEHIPNLIQEMAFSDLAWAGRAVILIDSNLGSGALSLLERQGAMPGSLNWLSTTPDRYLIEGQETAVRILRSLIKDRKTEIVEIRRGGKSDYLAGVQQGTDGFLRLLASTVDQFMYAGMDKPTAERTAASLMESSMRAYFRAGKRLLKEPKRRPSLPAR